MKENQENNQENNQVVLKKIPLEIFINALMDIYNSGIDYVDILGIPGEEQDNIGISFNTTYLSEDVKNDMIEDQNLNIKLSDEDLNQLS